MPPSKKPSLVHLSSVQENSRGNPAITWEQHKAKWKPCTRCDLCQTRNKVVLGRGTLPAPLLFIGEAPGASEDINGKPFWGPAGDLLQSILDRVVPPSLKYYITNLTGCIPKDDVDNKTGAPSEESIKSCAPRLEEVVAMCQPKIVVCVGDLSKKWVPKLIGKQLAQLADSRKDVAVQVLHVLHPAYLLRLDVSQFSIAVKRTEVVLEEAVMKAMR